ncbi:YhhN-like protein [Corynebacterium efficiens YS-314]|uniref:Lysoplasmalogenase n=1 Tax=Corynebacterium efficiens (strain DSM 44549 / YS-314 / AJ 12310 / JCM 11189 / NBRC 100395) TaxID=196164 RepID=Q8FSS4_COREF|nr:YhhN-like protein [Corynebacterium efficiens YS-314]BAC17118.1 hypothetical protein [Corynebacterium efficiens YS-314]
MTGFIDRTRQGVRALVTAVGRAGREPERAAYLVAADTNTLASLLGWSRLKETTKPALMPLLAGRVWRSGVPDKTVGMIGLAGGWAGDLALMKPGNIRAGATGFAANHAAYIYLLLNRGARPSTTRVAIRAVPLAAATALAARKAPGLLPVVLGYGGLLATTSVLADDPALINPGEPATYGLGHGGQPVPHLRCGVVCPRGPPDSGNPGRAGRRRRGHGDLHGGAAVAYRRPLPPHPPLT